MAAVNSNMNTTQVKNYCEICEFSSSHGFPQELYQGGCYCEKCRCPKYSEPFGCKSCQKNSEDKCRFKKNPKSNGFSMIDCSIYQELFEKSIIEV